MFNNSFCRKRLSQNLIYYLEFIMYYFVLILVFFVYRMCKLHMTRHLEVIASFYAIVHRRNQFRVWSVPDVRETSNCTPCNKCRSIVWFWPLSANLLSIWLRKVFLISLLRMNRLVYRYKKCYPFVSSIFILCIGIYSKELNQERCLTHLILYKILLCSNTTPHNWKTIALYIILPHPMAQKIYFWDLKTIGCSSNRPMVAFWKN